MDECDYIVSFLKLQPHPEGGFFASAVEGGSQQKLVEAGTVGRPCFSHIYYFLPSGEKSQVHCLDADEILHHYIGGSMTIQELRTGGELVTTVLGKDLRAGERLCHLVPAGSWFSMRAHAQGSFCLVGCTVSPSFLWEGFRFGSLEELLSLFPQHEDIIMGLF